LAQALWLKFGRFHERLVDCLESKPGTQQLQVWLVTRLWLTLTVSTLHPFLMPRLTAACCSPDRIRRRHQGDGLLLHLG